MAVIGIYGATDRFNYGDLLFPLVVDWAVRTFRDDATVSNYAIIDSDFSAQGGLATQALKSALSTRSIATCERIVIAGGQVLDARWTAILGYLLGPQTDLAIRGIRKLFGESVTDALARRVSGIPWPQPFVVPAGALPGITKVTYNSVGGAEIELLRTEYSQVLVAGLRAAAYVSVRDHATESALKRLGVDADLVPDSAVVMSRAFPKEWLMTRARSALVEYLSSNSGKYLVFQIGTKFLRGREASIAKTVAEISSKQGLKVVLLAIGTATAHEDHIALAKVRQHLPVGSQVMELYDGSVWEIMLTIASAALYVGTSLHGAITSISFDVPRLAYTGEVKKLTEFLSTWDRPCYSRSLPVEGDLRLVSEALSCGVSERRLVSDSLCAAASNGLSNAVCR